MGLVTLICPNCNGKLELDDNNKNWFCQYCGSKVALEEKKIEINGNVTLDSAASAKNLIERGYLFIDDSDFESANNYFEKALDLDAKAWRAYVGKLLCLLELKSIDDLRNSKPLLTEYEDFNKAIRFSPESDKEYFETIRIEVEERHNKETEEILKKQKGIRTEIEKNNEDSAELIRKNKLYKFECAGAWILTAVALVVWGILMNKAMWLIVIFIVFFLGAIVVTVITAIKRTKNNKKNKNNMKELEKLNELERELIRQRKQYNR